jgi:hypothetical protein
MQIALGSKGDYSVRGVLDLALLRRGPPQCDLRQDGHTAQVTTSGPRGPDQGGIGRIGRRSRGGYSLARPPREVSLLDVVEDAEGTYPLRKCLMRAGPRYRKGACSMHAVWAEAQEKMANQLAKASFGAVGAT